ncbi:MAG: proline--tRNA ligase [Candidatus Woesearchaeota archaeon]
MSKDKPERLDVKKENDFSEWYTQVITKSDLISYSNVSGCYVFKPRAYQIWEKIQDYFNKEIKKRGVKNAYFPMLIPEKLLNKEEEHVEGFSPEVAWVTHSGNSELNERLAIRPTSETVIYDSYKDWIRSYNDLPLKLNQWCNIVRWEFNNPVPFLRSREFLWQEGHTVFSNKKDAEDETKDILQLYKQVFEDLLAVPVIEGEKSEKERFAGAKFTLSVETFLPSGKAIQGATSHHLGQNFSKSFDITFTDENSEEKYAWQNSWGISTRSIGTMVMMHSDNKGLVLPPKVASPQVVIVPIIFKDSKDEVINACNKVNNMFDKDIDVLYDDRDSYSAGWKFNEWEMKGVPIRIEIGPRDVKNNKAVLVRRDTGDKITIDQEEIKEKVEELLEDIHNNLLENARTYIKENTVETDDFEQFKKAIKDGKLVKTKWCGSVDCEEDIKHKTSGAKSLNMSFSNDAKGKCVNCDKDAKRYTYFGKSY